MGKKICRVFLDFRSEPEPVPHQNQTAPQRWFRQCRCTLHISVFNKLTRSFLNYRMTLECVYKTLGTSIIYSPISPPSLIIAKSPVYSFSIFEHYCTIRSRKIVIFVQMMIIFCIIRPTFLSTTFIKFKNKDNALFSRLCCFCLVYLHLKLKKKFRNLI